MARANENTDLVRERRLCQIAVAMAALVPVSAGAAGVLLGTDLTGVTAIDASLDSHLRYLSGLLLGIGLSFWILMPHIEREKVRFRALTFLVVTGGCARLVSLATAGTPSRPMLAALVMELVVTPLLCLWQGRIARS